MTENTQFTQTGSGSFPFNNSKPQFHDTHPLNNALADMTNGTYIKPRQQLPSSFPSQSSSRNAQSNNMENQPNLHRPSGGPGTRANQLSQNIYKSSDTLRPENKQTLPAKSYRTSQIEVSGPEAHNYSIFNKQSSIEAPGKNYHPKVKIETSGDFSSDMTGERRSADVRRSFDSKKSYKNFGITHDEAYNITPLSPEKTSQSQSRVVVDGEIEEQNFQEGQSSGAEVAQIVLQKNPGISSLISESSRQIDKISKMLEGHRRQKSMKNEEYFHIKRDLLIPDTHQTQEKSPPEEFSGKGTMEKREMGSQTEDEGSNSGVKSIEEIYVIPWSDEREQLRRLDKSDDKIKIEKELGASMVEEFPTRDSLEEVINMDIQDHFEEMEEKRNMAKVNKLQKDFADFRAQHIRERALVNFNTNRPQLTLQQSGPFPVKRRSNIQSRQFKENFEPVDRSNDSVEKVPIERKTNPGFLSIDVSSQIQKENYRKSEAPASSKSQGSYLKKFQEYKDRRKVQNQSSHQGGDTPQKNIRHSRSSSNLNREIPMDQISTKQLKGGIENYHKKQMSGSIDPNIALSPNLCDSITERILASKKAGHNTSASNPMLKSEKNPRDVKIVRYCDYREARKAAQRKNIAHPLAQQLANLDLNRASMNNREIIDYEANQNLSQELNVQPPQEKFHKSSQSISHSLSMGLLKPKPLQESYDFNSNQSNKPLARTFRQEKQKGHKGLSQYEEILENYIRDHQLTEEIHTKRGTPLAYMKANTASQESLLKSLRLRQDMCTRRSYDKTARQGSVEYRVKDYDRESIERRESGGGSTMFTGMTTRRREDDEDNIYNKSIKWLLNKQKKLGDMQTKEIEEEMRECTFKPQLVTKELNAKGDFDYDHFVMKGRNKPSEQLSKMLSVDHR